MGWAGHNGICSSSAVNNRFRQRPPKQHALSYSQSQHPFHNWEGGPALHCVRNQQSFFVNFFSLETTVTHLLDIFFSQSLDFL